MSDTVPLLAVRTPLTASQVVASNPVILGQFVSLVVSCSADTATVAELQFSNDLASGAGNPWITFATKTFGAGVNSYETAPVIAKWFRLRLTEGDGVNQTRLSLDVYGSPANNSVSAKIEKIGNFNPEVDIGNLPLSGFGDLVTAEIHPLTQYVFAGAGAAAYQPTTVPLVSYYPSLKSQRLGLSTGARYNFPAGTGTIRLDAGTASPGVTTAHDQIYGARGRYRAGITVIGRFTARWDTDVNVFDVQAGNHAHMIIGLKSPGVSYYALGWTFEPGTSGAVRDFATEFGITYDDGKGGGRVFIPAGTWNGDKADGSGILPVLDTGDLNIFQIEISYLGAASVVFKCLDPSTLTFVTIHTIRFANSRPTTYADEPSFGFFSEYYASSGVGYTTLTAFAVESGSFATLSAGPRHIEFEEPSATDNTKTLVAATETVILSLRNGDGALGNLTPSAIDTFSFACDGNKPTVFRVYKDASVGGSAFGAINNYTPVEVDTAGTLSTGRLIASFALGAKDNLFVDKHGNELHMEPDEIVVFTAESPQATDAFVSTTFHLG